MKSVFLKTNGCAVLRHETYKMAKYFELNGIEEVPTIDNADYVIFNGCVVIEINEKQAFETLDELYAKKKKDALLIIGGCISKICLDKLKEKYSDNTYILNKGFDCIDDVINSKVKYKYVDYNINPKYHHSFGDPNIFVSKEKKKDDDLCKLMRENNFYDYDLQYRYKTQGKHLWLDETLYEIRTSYGCSGKCSYCITKKGIGPFKSVPLDRILAQVKDAKKANYNRIMLMGDEIGNWNYNDKNIINLLDEIGQIDSNFKIGIRYIQPDIVVKYFDDIYRLAKSGLIAYFCSAFQSGSSKILQKMNRTPEICEFISCISKLKKETNVIIHTQVIVGFPYETDIDFMETVKCLQKAKFDYVTVSKYSVRTGTKAASFPQLDSKIIDERYDFLIDYLEELRKGQLYELLKRIVLNNEILVQKKA